MTSRPSSIFIDQRRKGRWRIQIENGKKGGEGREIVKNSPVQCALSKDSFSISLRQRINSPNNKPWILGRFFPIPHFSLSSSSTTWYRKSVSVKKESHHWLWNKCFQLLRERTLVGQFPSFRFGCFGEGTGGSRRSLTKIRFSYDHHQPLL